MSKSPVAGEMVSAPFSRREQRLAMRYPCRARGSCQPVTANEAGNRWPVAAVDISTGGVGLLVCRRFEPCTLLAVELSRQSNQSIYLPLARVCRVTPVGLHWLLGCVWQGGFSADDMQPLVGAAALWQAVRARFGQALAASRSAVISPTHHKGTKGTKKSKKRKKV